MDIKKMDYEKLFRVERERHVETKKRGAELVLQNEKTLEALKGIYNMLPRWSCQSQEPDDCAVCKARLLITEAYFPAERHT